MSVTPVALVVRIVVSSFVAEFVSMLLLDFVKIENTYIEAVADSALLTILLVPMLWCWVYHPIKNSFAASLQKEKTYRKLIESTDTGYAILSLEGAIVEVNSNFKKMLHSESKKVLIGEKFSSLFSEEQKRVLDNSLSKILTDKKNVIIRFGMNADETPFVLSMSMYYVVEHSSELIFVLCLEEPVV